jgi:hypothetical protein
LTTGNAADIGIVRSLEPCLSVAQIREFNRRVLDTLGKSKGMLGIIFRKAQNKIQDPAKLRRLIADLIAADIAEDLRAALEQFETIQGEVGRTES